MDARFLFKVVMRSGGSDELRERRSGASISPSRWWSRLRTVGNVWRSFVFGVLRREVARCSVAVVASKSVDLIVTVAGRGGTNFVFGFFRIRVRGDSILLGRIHHSISELKSRITRPKPTKMALKWNDEYWQIEHVSHSGEPDFWFGIWRGNTGGKRSYII